MPKIHEIIAMQMLDDARFRSSVEEAMARAGYPVTLPARELLAPQEAPPEAKEAPVAEEWRILGQDELIQPGDQWTLIAQPDRWRPVGNSVGTRPEVWKKSIFRRKVGVEQQAVQEVEPPAAPAPRRELKVGELAWFSDNGNSDSPFLGIYSGQNQGSPCAAHAGGNSRWLYAWSISETKPEWLVGKICVAPGVTGNFEATRHIDDFRYHTSRGVAFTGCELDEWHYIKEICEARGYSVAANFGFHVNEVVFTEGGKVGIVIRVNGERCYEVVVFTEDRKLITTRIAYPANFRREWMRGKRVRLFRNGQLHARCSSEFEIREDSIIAQFMQYDDVQLDVPFYSEELRFQYERHLEESTARDRADAVVEAPVNHASFNEGDLVFVDPTRPMVARIDTIEIIGDIPCYHCTTEEGIRISCREVFELHHNPSWLVGKICDYDDYIINVYSHTGIIAAYRVHSEYGFQSTSLSWWRFAEISKQYYTDLINRFGGA